MNKGTSHAEEKKGWTGMKLYKIDGQVVISDKDLTLGTELIPNTTDAAGEKHVPVITTNGNEVKIEVGSVEHPSLPAHFITFILLETSSGIHTKWLKAGDVPSATFILAEGENVVSAYEYCNLHGLWKAEAWV